MKEYFPRLFGNEKAKNRIGRAILGSTLPHALLIIGEEGSGKRTLALEIATSLNCENKGKEGYALPCDTCNTCKRIREGNYLDLTRLSRARDKATIGVEEVRLFREDMFLSSTESQYKLYVIEEADRLTPNAQNALLKVLEEPPKNVIIILIAESSDKILTTIKSRAESVFMEHFSNEALSEYLAEASDKARLMKKSHPEAFMGVVMSADGKIGKALSMLSDKDREENESDRRLTENIVEKMKQGVPYSELYCALSSLPTSRTQLIEALEFVIVALRDLILLRTAKSPSLLFFTSKQKAEKLSNSMNLKRLTTLYDLTRGALEDATKNVSVGAIVSDLGVKIKQI